MPYFLYIFFGLAPSIIWLLFYLRKDAHPESNKMIIKIFLFGMIIAGIAGLVEIGVFDSFSTFYNKHETLKKIDNYSSLFLIIYIFLGIAFVEEFLKYLVVRQKVLKNSEFDEPVDALLYMIIVALGFAALENILVLLPAGKPLFFIETLSTSILRFVGATFLHALCSGTLGYFLALSIYEHRKKTRLIASGLIIATFLHGLYNFSIIKMDTSPANNNLIFIPVIIIISLAFFVSFGFKHLKKIDSICKIR